MRLVYKGLYGPIKPGTFLEMMAIQGLKDQQQEDILRTRLLLYAGQDGVKAETLREAYKEYTAAASPHINAEIKRKDEKMKREIEEEVKRGSFLITPLHDPNSDSITLRTEARKPRKLRIRKDDNNVLTNSGKTKLSKKLSDMKYGK